MTGATTKFVIADPIDGFVGVGISVTIRAFDQFDNVATSEEQDVVLETSSSTVDGGTVDITSGVGVITITNSAAETVTLSLAAVTGFDTSSTQTVVFVNPPGKSSMYISKF